MEVATLAGSAEDSLVDRAEVVVEDPAVADSNEGEFMLNEMMHRPVVKPELVEYMRTSQRRFPGGLGELENMANELGIPIIPHETAVFLDFIVGLFQPKNILEIGTAVGFSASLMATASPQAKVTTIDRYELMYSRAKANFEKLGLADRITQLEGDAADILPTLEQGKYDFLFMDSAKAKYIEFFPYCMDVLEVGGVLVVDDIFQGGTILEDVMERPRRVRKIHRRLNMFLDLVQSDPTLKSTLLPLGDGIIMIQKMEEKDFKYILEDL